MATNLFFCLALLGVASSRLPEIRRCDPEERRETPTLCSNYRNIEYLHDKDATLQRGQTILEQRVRAEERKTSNTIEELKTLVKNLSSAIEDLERVKSQTEREFKDTRTQLGKLQDDFAGLKRDVGELVEDKERVAGNFSEIEQRLNATKRQLGEKNARLENLETETEAAFTDTQRLLNLYKGELSHLNTTTQELQVQVDAQLDATKMELEAEMKKVQRTSENFSRKLNEHKGEVDGFKGEADIKFRNIDQQLNRTLNKQEADTDTLQSKITGMAKRLKSAEEKIDQQNKLKSEVDGLKAEVHAKVAFSATVIESKDVFTGPQTVGTNNTLIFNRVFSNVGNAYNSKTGIFTAPLKGLYHFSFTTFGYNSHTSGAILVKNGHYQVSTWEFTGPDVSDTTSTAVILELNVRDRVNIILWQDGKIHTGVFSGFLVFPTS